MENEKEAEVEKTESKKTESKKTKCVCEKHRGPIMIIVAVAIIAIGFGFYKLNEAGQVKGAITQAEAKSKIEDFVNNSLMQPGTKAEII